MTRADLLALTLDDLTVLSNRGLVKRAQRELESEEFTYQYTESTDRTISLQWSDGFDCSLPADSVICDRHCTCTATTLCRHLIRSVLAYQTLVQSSGSTTQEQVEANAPLSPPLSNQSWNPGDIPDTEIAQHFKASQIERLQRQFNTDLAIEVTCSTKPTARLHTLGHTLRFLVPGDIRYTYCDCTAPAPCSHVPLAIWAFRKLPPEQKSGIISTETKTNPAPIALLDDIEDALCELLAVGLKGISQALIGRFQRLEKLCRQESLIWPAEIILELLQQCDYYSQRDARFSGNQVFDLMGELGIRMDAIRSNTGATPQLFIRGTQFDRTTELGAARLIGLGCGVQVRQRNVRISSYFQDTDSGAVMALSQDFAEPPKPTEPLKDFWQLAQTRVLKQNSLETLGAGQLLIKSGKRSPDFQLLPGRSQVIVNPQTFQWESLRSPLLIEDFAELHDRFSHLPPKSLRPRRITETLHVLAIERVEEITFSNVEKAVIAILYDRSGNSANLYFPYHYRANLGTEVLLNSLNQLNLCFVAGEVYLKNNQLVVVPISLIFQGKEKRFILQPWIYKIQEDLCKLNNKTDNLLFTNSIIDATRDTIDKHIERYIDKLMNFITLGIENNEISLMKTLQDFNEIYQEFGFSSLLSQNQKLIKCLSKDSSIIDNNFTKTMKNFLDLIIHLKLSQDLLL
jgi:hypothetical protein